VLVVGGGIAGMRASLDLADQGFKVYLVEKESAIGGKMAQLDKTFPTNDCAMCNISPILVETGNHPNIEILTNTSVLDISGKRGNFSVQVQHEPRYIDHDKCVACNDCVEVCPVTIPDLFNEALVSKTAIYKQYPQAIPNAYAIEKAGIAPCRAGCPAGQRAQGYIALIVQGRYREALQVIKEDNPFPSVCSRTCHHPCESKCTLNLIGDPVNIMSLKRFVVDHSLAYGRDKVEPAPRTKPEWVAIIGAGPAGLTAAHDLAKLGYGTTVFEALPVAGGMMRAGIPAHRLPKGDLQQDIDDILALGVVLKTNSPIINPTKLLEEGYNAVCLATGISTEDHSLGLEGEDAEGVIPAATFLRKINLGEPVMIGNRVAVLGGGITALDSAAVAQRLGSESVHLVLHRPRGELPAYHWEFDAVESEGIHILERTTATRILTENGKVVGIELAEIARGSITDKHGRSRPKVKDGTEFTLEVDTVIGTVGQFSDLSFLDSDFDDLEVDLDTLVSEIPGLFVVGGRKTGASFIIEAISLGHRVAKSIHSYLQGFPLDKISAPRPLVVEFSREDMIERVQSGEVILQPRIEPSLLSMEERMTSFREVMLGFTEAQARKEANRCLQCGICSECLACVIACGADAIDHDMVAKERLLNVGGLILAPGYQTYRAELSEEYGFGRYLNVLTSIQFERLLSASGPTFGHINRPSDEKVPKRIAFLQCIGSRDQDHNYCSSTCCMAATKEAVIAKQHHPEIEIHVFMMDMRAYSKGYWEYFVRAQEQYGVQYHRCRISGLSENSETNNLILQHLPEDSATFKTVKDEFDLVVLSVGMEISEDVKVLGRRLGIDLDEYGFCHNVKFNPIETSLPGIYAVGPFREPKDIPESVIEASGAAGAIGTFLNKARFTQTTAIEFPTERDVQCDPPRVGVFVCHCGSNIGGYLDVPEVTEYASTLPLVVHAEDNLYSCSQDSIKHITETVKEENLNRVVVASCTPLTHQPLFRNSIRDAGLNPYLFEMANIRNQCSWVHSNDNPQATAKAKDLVRMAVAKVIKQTAQSTIDVPIEKTGLVVGGGAAGMTAALTLADHGFPVHLVEKESELGGQLRNIHTPLNGKDPQSILKELLKKTGNHKNITIHLNSQIIGTSGFKGNFSSEIRDEDERTESINHGVTILATGGKEYEGSEYGFGTDPRILTQQGFEELITNQPGGLDPNSIKSVVMIQCIGPAETYCSRICCTVALKNALAIKEKLPDTQVSIIYKDIRVFGFNEKLYTDVRNLGVLFFRYDDDHKPEVSIGVSDNPKSMPGTSPSTLTISVWDKSLQRVVRLHTDLLVLSMPVIPHSDMKDLANKFKVSLDNNGFFLEAHVKLRPVDFSTEGIFMAGLAHFPKLIEESMIQAQAAASRASMLLSKDFLKAGGAIAVVEQQFCTGCLTCVRVCPFGVPVIQADVLGVGNVLGAAYIEPAICQGCGICVAECPAKAIDLMHYTEDQLSSKVTALLNPEMFMLEVI
jgi:heterodisulfide reductase subunit A-like polyferredoxin